MAKGARPAPPAALQKLRCRAEAWSCVRPSGLLPLPMKQSPAQLTNTNSSKIRKSELQNPVHFQCCRRGKKHFLQVFLIPWAKPRPGTSQSNAPRGADESEPPMLTPWAVPPVQPIGNTLGYSVSLSVARGAKSAGTGEVPHSEGN